MGLISNYKYNGTTFKGLQVKREWPSRNEWRAFLTLSITNLEYVIYLIRKQNIRFFLLYIFIQFSF